MVNTLSLKRGMLVIHRSGRDAGKMMMVLEVLDDQYVLLVDGKGRTLAKPKKKKALHLQKTRADLMWLLEQRSEMDLNDHCIRKAIEAMTAQEEI